MNAEVWAYEAIVALPVFIVVVIIAITSFIHGKDNARLIAAAPELLEALKAVEPYLLAGDTELHDLVGRAIAKAEGR